MKECTYWIVDAFSLKPYHGNPAAIVFGAEGMSGERMQVIARHFNLSETVFLCRPRQPDADYLARIFTPKREVPFAGHPTVASAFAHHACLSEEEREGVTRLSQECGIGVVPVGVETRSGNPFFNVLAGTPSAVRVDVSPDLAGSMLGCRVNDLAPPPVEVCSGGLPWMVVKVASPEVSRRLRPDPSLIERVCREHGATGITTYSDGAELPEGTHHLRTFAPGVGIAEDPACGSGTIAVAIHMARHGSSGSAFTFVGEQGLEVGRESILHVRVDESGPGRLVIRLGGHAVRSMEGRLLA